MTQPTVQDLQAQLAELRAGLDAINGNTEKGRLLAELAALEAEAPALQAERAAIEAPYLEAKYAAAAARDALTAAERAWGEAARIAANAESSRNAAAAAVTVNRIRQDEIRAALAAIKAREAAPIMGVALRPRP